MTVVCWFDDFVRAGNGNPIEKPLIIEWRAARGICPHGDMRRQQQRSLEKNAFHN